jgi:hypothetical protein
MSNPLDSVKREAAEHAISIWQGIPKINSESELTPSNGWHDEYISKLFNIIRCRLSETNLDIISLYCRLVIEMINKGVTVKNKYMKTIVPVVVYNMTKGSQELKNLFK